LLWLRTRSSSTSPDSSRPRSTHFLERCPMFPAPAFIGQTHNDSAGPLCTRATRCARAPGNHHECNRVFVRCGSNGHSPLALQTFPWQHQRTMRLCK
jgi:hypothetical protein